MPKINLYKTKIFNPLLDMYFIKKSIAINDDKKVIINPTRTGKNGNLSKSLNELKNSTIAASEIEGTPRKKENFAASFFSHPDKRAIEIVDPDLDTPGIMASA